MQTQLLAQNKTKIDLLTSDDWISYNSSWEIRPNLTNNKLTAFKEGGGTYTFINGGEEIFEVGKKYRISFKVIGMTNAAVLGSKKVWLRLSNSYTSYYTGNGSYSEILDCNYSSDLYINGNEAFDGGVYDIFIEDLGYTNIDINPGSEILISKSVADVRDIEGRFGSSTKEFICPDTEANNRFFKYIYNINQSNVFNTNVKVSCVVLQDSQEVLTGYLQLVRILVNDDRVDYVCVIYGDSLDFFKNISEKKLSDLNASALEHEYNYTNTHSGYGSVKYPIIERSKPLTYEYLTTNHTSPAPSLFRGLQVDDLWGAVNAKWILDQIHSEEGIEYESDIFDESHFSYIHVPVNNWEHDSDWLSKSRTVGPYTSDNMEFRQNGSIGASGYELIIPAGSVGYSYVAETSQTEPTDNWWKKSYKPPEGCYQRFNFNFTCSPANVGPANPLTIKIRIYDTRRGGGYYSNASQTLEEKTFSYNDNGDINAGFTTQEYYVPKNNDPTNFSTGVKCIVTITGPAGGIILTDPAWIFSSTITNKDISTSIAPTSTITNYTELLEDMSQLDYLKSLMKMFNIYVDYNKDTDKIIYRTKDNYYENGSTHTWEMDTDSEVDIQLLSELQNRDFLFTHNNGGDTEADDYEEKYNKVYGEYRLTSDNEFVTGEQEINSNSNSTILKSVDGWSFPMYVSAFNGAEAGLRFLYVTQQYIGSNDAYYMTDEYFDFSYAQHYQHASHLYYPDNDITTNYDLNYGLANYQFDTSVYGETTNNLYNLYYKNPIENLLSKDSKMVTAYFKLSPNQITELELNDTIFIEKHQCNYYINKLIDYHPDRLTKVELIKMDDVSIDYLNENPGATFINDGVINNSVVGYDNFIDASSSGNIVHGNNNMIGANSFNNRIYGTNNIVGDNVQNCVIDNSNSVTIGYRTQSSGSTKVYVSGVTSSGETTIDAQYLSIKNSSEIEFENGSSYIDIKTSNDLLIKAGSTKLTIDSESYKTIGESNVSILRGAKVSTGGEIYNDYGGINDPGSNTVQVEFSNGVVNDCGENQIWQLDYIDSDTLLDPGEDVI